MVYRGLVADRSSWKIVHVIVSLVVNLVLFLLAAAVASLAAARLARSSHEEWQLLAWVPVLPLVIWGVLVAIAVTRDPTSHNLWPFELVFWSVVTAALFAGVMLGRWLAGRRTGYAASRRDRDRNS
jgi:hypothetical protein